MHFCENGFLHFLHFCEKTTILTKNGTFPVLVTFLWSFGKRTSVFLRVTPTFSRRNHFFGTPRMAFSVYGALQKTSKTTKTHFLRFLVFLHFLHFLRKTVFSKHKIHCLFALLRKTAILTKSDENALFSVFCKTALFSDHEFRVLQYT